MAAAVAVEVVEAQVVVTIVATIKIVVSAAVEVHLPSSSGDCVARVVALSWILRSLSREPRAVTTHAPFALIVLCRVETPGLKKDRSSSEVVMLHQSVSLATVKATAGCRPLKRNASVGESENPLPST